MYVRGLTRKSVKAPCFNQCTTPARSVRPAPKKDTLAMIKFVDTYPHAAKCVCRAAFYSCRFFGQNYATCRAVYAIVPTEAYSVAVSDSPLITGRDFVQIKSSLIAARRVSDMRRRASVKSTLMFCI